MLITLSNELFYVRGSSLGLKNNESNRVDNVYFRFTDQRSESLSKRSFVTSESWVFLPLANAAGLFICVNTLKRRRKKKKVFPILPIFRLNCHRALSRNVTKGTEPPGWHDRESFRYFYLLMFFGIYVWKRFLLCVWRKARKKNGRRWIPPPGIVGDTKRILLWNVTRNYNWVAFLG